MLRGIVTKVCAMLGRARSSSAHDRALMSRVTRAVPPKMQQAPTSNTLVMPTTPALPTEAVPTTTSVGTKVGIVFAPTRADRVPTLSVVGTHADLSRKSACRQPFTPDAAASAFLDWFREHDLAARPWAVDDVWYLASEDFAPATDVALPPRNLFLGALHRRKNDVRVQHDKRIWLGPRKVKTTVYTFAPVGQTTASAAANLPPGAPAQEGFKRAA